MAHLWIVEPPGEWSILPLRPPRVDLACLTAGSLRTRGGREAAREAGAILLQIEAPDGADWHLIAALDADIAINGLPLVGGLHVMEDRDEIRLPDGESLFFSTEELAQATSSPATGTSITCPRCRQHIDAGSPAVRCPQCGIWHHQKDDLQCWTYSPTCALCPQPTALDEGFRWTPAEL